MELLANSLIYEWLTDRDNLKDFIVPSATLFLTIFFSIRVAKSSFERDKELQVQKEKKSTKEVANLVSYANESILKDLNKVKERIKENRGNINFRNFHSLSYPVFNKAHYDIIHRMDFSVFFSNVSQYDINRDLLYAYIICVSDIKSNIIELEKYTHYVRDEYTKLNHKINTEMPLITVWMNDSIHKVTPPFTDVQLNLDVPVEALAFELSKIYQTHKVNDRDLSVLEANKALLESMDALRYHVVASKALSGEIAERTALCISIIRNFDHLFDLACQSFDNFLTAINNSYQSIEMFQNHFRQHQEHE